MRRPKLLAVLGTAALLASGLANIAPAYAATDPIGMNAVYEYFGWGTPQAPTSVMSATGIKQFTLAFMLSDGGCTPKWTAAGR